jgi:hypothetical protein
MWTILSRIILRYRVASLVVIGSMTLFMGYMATQVQMSYEMARMLPAGHPASRHYEAFRETFGKDGAVIFVGFKGDSICTLPVLHDVYTLTAEIGAMEGIKEVLSLARVYELKKDTAAGQFVFRLVSEESPLTQEACDSLCAHIAGLPFYRGLLLNEDSGVHLMAITLEEEMLDSRKRVKLIFGLKEKIEAFSVRQGVQVHFSGMPYIRTITTKKVQDELLLFTLAALGIAGLLLLYFFRSKKAVLLPLFIVSLSVVWAMGSIALFGFRITILTGLIPPLLIVIGVENCIFLLNRFHTEFLDHGNKVKALVRVVARTGKANILTNLTTAAGFAAFLVTGNRLLTEFGLVASINILFVFFLSLFLIPIFYSYLPDPQPRHLAHIEEGFTGRLILRILHIVQNHRRWVYAGMFLMLVLSGWGITRLESTGRIVDDIPQKDALYRDLQFFEETFGGVLPLEIVIDTRKPKGVRGAQVIRRIDQMQKVLNAYPELSRSLSLADAYKYARQAFYNGNPAMYALPDAYDMPFILRYIPESSQGGQNILKAFVDSTYQKARISLQMANLGTHQIEDLEERLRPRIDSVFQPDKYDVTLTGSSIVFLKGSRYLVKNLVQSLALAIVLITALMALLFTSWRMILIALVPNLLPQVMTAALMGFSGIPIKPSTILIFSIALGISVDNTIHFLSRYRYLLRHNNWNIRQSVAGALGETGYSMIYSSSVLFFGFAIFLFSGFGGTQAMGYLISFTLLAALFSNLFLLPSFLLWLDKMITTRSFEDPVLEILDEEKENGNGNETGEPTVDYATSHPVQAKNREK